MSIVSITTNKVTIREKYSKIPERKSTTNKQSLRRGLCVSSIFLFDYSVDSNILSSIPLTLELDTVLTIGRAKTNGH